MKWLPPNGAVQGVAFDHLLRWNLSAVFWLFIVAQILLVAALLRPRSRSRHGRTPTGRFLLIADYAILLALTGLYIGMAITGQHLWAARREAAASAQSVKVEVTGVQFQWYFRYPGPDGIYGATRPSLVNAPNGNPLGLDPQDPHSRDDVVSALLVLPANRPVDLRLRSLDVIHGFFIPGMRLKQDAVPGMLGYLQFTPTTPGNYPILCSQVCGLGHARMQARLRVVSQSDYDGWLAARQRATLAPANPEPLPPASTGGRP